MLNVKALDELARKIAEAMPPAVGELQQDVERNVRSALQSSLARLNLVTREEFDVQQNVLLATRRKVEMLEKRLKELERRAGDAGDSAQDPTQ